MNAIFKTLAYGFLYLVLSPVIVLILALGLVFGLIVFVVQFFKEIVVFFTGRTLFSDYPEDIEAKRRKSLRNQAMGNPSVTGGQNHV